MKVTTTQPTDDLVLLPLATVKDRLRISGTDNDDVLTALISETRSLIEGWCSCSIGQQTKVLTGYLTHDFDLPYGPVISLTTVTKENGSYTYDAQTVNDDYRYINDSFIVLGDGNYSITYEAGYVEDDIPQGLINAWIELIVWCYVNRGDTNEQVPAMLKKKLNPYKRTFGI